MRARWIVLLSFLTSLSPAGAAEALWTSRDYLNLYFQHHNGKVPLPHLRETKQKALFDHLVDPRNISAIVEAPIPVDEKLRQLRIILATLGSYRASYNIAVAVGEPVAQELASVQAYSLSVAAALARMMPQPGGADAAHAARATLVEGTIEAVGESERYSPAQSALIAEAIAAYYPVIAGGLSNEDRDRLRAEVTGLGAKGITVSQRAAIARMKQAVTEAP